MSSLWARCFCYIFLTPHLNGLPGTWPTGFTHHVLSDYKSLLRNCNSGNWRMTLRFWCDHNFFWILGTNTGNAHSNFLATMLFFTPLFTHLKNRLWSGKDYILNMCHKEYSGQDPDAIRFMTAMHAMWIYIVGRLFAYTHRSHEMALRAWWRAELATHHICFAFYYTASQQNAKLKRQGSDRRSVSFYRHVCCSCPTPGSNEPRGTIKLPFIKPCWDLFMSLSR